jgi:hypothetical protein
MRPWGIVLTETPVLFPEKEGSEDKQAIAVIFPVS